MTTPTTPTTFIVEFRRGRYGDPVARWDGYTVLADRHSPTPQPGEMWEVRPISTNRSGSVLYVRLLRRPSPEEWEAEQRRRVAALLAEFGAENLPPEWEAHADWRGRSVEIRRSDLRWRDDRLYRYREWFSTPAWRGERRKRFDNPAACRAWLAVAIPEWESAITKAMDRIAAEERRAKIKARLDAEAKRVAEQILAREDLFLAAIHSGAWHDAPDGGGRWRVALRDSFFVDKPCLVKDMAVDEEGITA